MNGRTLMLGLLHAGAACALMLLSCSRAGLEIDARRPCPASCDDGIFCNGVESCDETRGVCVPATEPVNCNDNDECTLDMCDEIADRCAHTPTPRDNDGDGYNACNEDCDDTNPNIHPDADEVCNGVDDDCDGLIDEGLASECGDCRPGCRILELPNDDLRQPPGSTGWQTGTEFDSAVGVRPDGSLVLQADNDETYFAWIANSSDSRVTKLDTRTGAQVAVYDSVLLGPDTHPALPSVRCSEDAVNPNTSGNCPSRTAVDLQGAMYVANRAFGRQGTVTKIAGFRDDCVDRNGDGVIQTSEDVNGNGRIDRNVAGEYLGQDDECLLWTVDVGGDGGGVPRAIAVSGDGTVWVGLHRDQRVVQLDPTDGRVLTSLVVPTFRPYGAAFDRQGRLWMTSSLSGEILSVDTRSGRVGEVLTAPSPERGCPSSYGIAVDPSDRVWIAGFTCPYAFRFDPATRTWLSVRIPGAGVTRGIAARDDGLIFVAASHDWLRVDLSASNPLEASDPITRLTVFNGDDGSNVRLFGTFDEPLLGSGSIGVGLDSAGRAWLVNQSTASATRVDIESGEVRRFAAGPEPYTYSDFTGYALRRITAPNGFVRSVLDGCVTGPTEWEELTWDARIPAGARLELRLRAAETREALETATWQGPFSREPLDMGAVPKQRFLEVETRLVSANGSSTPALSTITIRLHCPG